MGKKFFRKSDKSSLTRNIINVVAITAIATTAITWIGIMEIKKTKRK